MGWASGSNVVIRVAEAVREVVGGPYARKAIYRSLVDACEDGDWDTQDEAMGIDPVLDLLLLEDQQKWMDSSYGEEYESFQSDLAEAQAAWRDMVASKEQG